MTANQTITLDSFTPDTEKSTSKAAKRKIDNIVIDNMVELADDDENSKTEYKKVEAPILKNIKKEHVSYIQIISISLIITL